MENRKALLISELMSLVNLMTKDYKESFRKIVKGYIPNLSFEHSMILLSLDRNQGSSQTSLSQKLGKDPASISRMITTLAKRNLVFQKRSGKEKKIYLSPDGYELAQQLKPIYKKSMLEFGMNIHEKELSIMKEIILRLRRNKKGV